MSEIKLKPVLIVADSYFEAMKELKGNIEKLYGNSISNKNLTNVLFLPEVETNFSIMLNKITKSELNDFIFKSDLLMRTINKFGKFVTPNKTEFSDMLTKCRAVGNSYNKIINTMNEREINKSFYVFDSKLLDLNNTYDQLSKDKIIDFPDFILISVTDDFIVMMENWRECCAVEKQEEANKVFRYCYSLVLKANFILKDVNINENNKGIAKALLPYIKSFSASIAE